MATQCRMCGDKKKLLGLGKNYYFCSQCNNYLCETCFKKTNFCPTCTNQNLKKV